MGRMSDSHLVVEQMLQQNFPLSEIALRTGVTKQSIRSIEKDLYEEELVDRFFHSHHDNSSDESSEKNIPFNFFQRGFHS